MAGTQLVPYGICSKNGRVTDRLVRAMASCSSCRACCCCTCFLFSRSISSSSRSVCAHHDNNNSNSNGNNSDNNNNNNHVACQPGLGACGASLNSSGRLVLSRDCLPSIQNQQRVMQQHIKVSKVHIQGLGAIKGLGFRQHIKASKVHIQGLGAIKGLGFGSTSRQPSSICR